MLSTLVGLHPGHGATDPHALLHYVTEPLHAAILALAIGALLSLGAWQWLRRRGKSTDTSV
jgi:hypothetical protein